MKSESDIYFGRRNSWARFGWAILAVLLFCGVMSGLAILLLGSGGAR